MTEFDEIILTNLVTLKVIAGAILLNVQISQTLTSSTNFSEITFTNLDTLKAQAKHEPYVPQTSL